MKKRVISVLIMLCLAVELTPVRAWAAEQLSAPTELKWGISYGESGSFQDAMTVPGVVSWKAGDNRATEFLLQFYQNGEISDDIPSLTITAEEVEVYSDPHFLLNDLESGNYYFTVTAIGDGNNYSNSESARSETWSYTRPSAQLNQVTVGNWIILNQEPAASWTALPSENIFSYEIELFYSSTEDGNYACVSGIYSNEADSEWDGVTFHRQDISTPGFYKYRVRAISGDITEYQNGPWSELSVAYHLESTTPPEPSKTELTTAMFNVDNDPEIYDGGAKTKTITSSLTLGTDYTVSYSNNVDVGTATITITGKGEYSGVIEYSFLIVSETDVTLNISRNNVQIVKGATAKPKSTCSPQNATITWVSSDSSVVFVDEDGMITGVADGSATITGTVTYGGKTATASYTATVSSNVSIAFAHPNITLRRGVALSESYTYRPSNATVTITSSDPSVAEITGNWSSNGRGYTTIKAVGAGTSILTLTAICGDIERISTCRISVPANEADLIQNYIAYITSFRNYPYSKVNNELKNKLFTSSTSWCANFVSQAAKDVGLGEIIPLNGGCSKLYNTVVEAGGIPVTNPQPGDIIFFKWTTNCTACSDGNRNAANLDRFNHTGLVTAVNGNIITVTHGNYGKINGEKKVTINNWDVTAHKCIAVFVRPNYAALAQLKRGTETHTYKCPIDVRYIYDGEVLDSATGQLEASFGTMVVNDEEESITVTLNDYYDVDVEITGNGEGTMDLTATFEDEDGTTSTRSFQNVPITTDTVGKLYATDSVATAYLELYKNSGTDFEEVWTADKNETATEKDAELTDWYTSDNDFGDDEPDPTPTPEPTPTSTPIPAPTPTPTPTPSPSQPSGGGGGSSTPSYAIEASTAEHGKVSLPSKRAERGKKVTVTVTPEEGYELDTLTVTDSKGKPVEVIGLGEGKYTFVMPSSKVKVTATFQKKEEPPVTPPPAETPASVPSSVPVTDRFTDIRTGNWYVDAIQYVCDKEMMNGVTKDTFSPNTPTSRGMLVTILYRLEEEPSVSAAPFSDVAREKYYASAVAWASQNDLVNGFENGTFRPDNSITREQLAVILYRYAAHNGWDVTDRADLSNYTDTALISTYAKEALSWAKAVGVITGTDWGGIHPGGNTTRAETAAILMRFCENVMP